MQSKFWSQVSELSNFFRCASKSLQKMFTDMQLQRGSKRDDGTRGRTTKHLVITAKKFSVYSNVVVVVSGCDFKNIIYGPIAARSARASIRWLKWQDICTFPKGTPKHLWANFYINPPSTHPLTHTLAQTNANTHVCLTKHCCIVFGHLAGLGMQFFERGDR